MDDFKDRALELAVRACPTHSHELLVQTAAAFEAYLRGTAPTDAPQALEEPKIPGLDDRPTEVWLVLTVGKDETTHRVVAKGKFHEVRDANRDNIMGAAVLALTEMLNQAGVSQ